MFWFTRKCAKSPCEVKRSSKLPTTRELIGKWYYVCCWKYWFNAHLISFFTFFVWKDFERNHGYHMTFRYSCPWFEETHFSLREGLLLPVAKQLGNCPTSASSMEPPNGILQLSSCGSWKSPWTPKKIAPSYHGKQGLVLCIFTVSSIQEAKLVCIVFVFFRNAGV